MNINNYIYVHRNKAFSCVGIAFTSEYCSITVAFKGKAYTYPLDHKSFKMNNNEEQIYIHIGSKMSYEDACDYFISEVFIFIYKRITSSAAHALVTKFEKDLKPP